MKHGNPAMLPQDHHAIKMLLQKPEAELKAEARAHPCKQCQLMAGLCEDYGRRLGVEIACNDRQRSRLIAVAAYAAAATIALLAAWWARS